MTAPLIGRRPSRGGVDRNLMQSAPLLVPYRSPLTRGRGSKRFVVGVRDAEDEVAPHAGAWIETTDGKWDTMKRIVAPHAGAWIETANFRRRQE